MPEDEKKPVQMAIRRNYTGHWSVGAINGDFFNLATGMPNNIQVENGEVLRNERADWPTVGFNTSNDVSISKPYLTGKIFLKDTSLVMNGVNAARENNNLIFYNQYFGTSTRYDHQRFRGNCKSIKCLVRKRHDLLHS
ncbi:MAG: phosphodiester glycosidase family protein [Ignavibacteriales bacterium]|nr:phosphodiester glycosidase family protein [Ignavibacteriales bacterium]